MRAVIYADNSGQAGCFVARLTAGHDRSGRSRLGWVDFPVSGSPTLPAGVYWLGYWSQNTSAQGYYDTVAGGGRYAPAGYSATANPPASFPHRHRRLDRLLALRHPRGWRSRRAGQHQSADDPWDCEPLRARDRRPRQLDEQPDRLQLPGAALRRQRPELRRLRSRSERPDLLRLGGRTLVAGGRDRDQRAGSSSATTAVKYVAPRLQGRSVLSRLRRLSGRGADLHLRPADSSIRTAGLGRSRSASRFSGSAATASPNSPPNARVQPDRGCERDQLRAAGGRCRPHPPAHGDRDQRRRLEQRSR